MLESAYYFLSNVVPFMQASWDSGFYQFNRHDLVDYIASQAIKES